MTTKILVPASPSWNTSFFYDFQLLANPEFVFSIHLFHCCLISFHKLFAKQFLQVAKKWGQKNKCAWWYERSIREKKTSTNVILLVESMLLQVNKTNNFFIKLTRRVKVFRIVLNILFKVSLFIESTDKFTLYCTSLFGLWFSNPLPLALSLFWMHPFSIFLPCLPNSTRIVDSTSFIVFVTLIGVVCFRAIFFLVVVVVVVEVTFLSLLLLLGDGDWSWLSWRVVKLLFLGFPETEYWWSTIFSMLGLIPLEILSFVLTEIRRFLMSAKIMKMKIINFVGVQWADKMFICQIKRYAGPTWGRKYRNSYRKKRRKKEKKH